MPVNLPGICHPAIMQITAMINGTSMLNLRFLSVFLANNQIFEISDCDSSGITRAVDLAEVPKNWDRWARTDFKISNTYNIH